MEYTVCIVDDEELSERMLSSILKIEGYNIISASNGKKALTLFETHRPDIILLDIDMPEMNGLELIEKIKLKPELKDIPVIFISAHSDLDTKVKGLYQGGIDFISKPFQNAEVISRVSVHLENSLLHRKLKELNNKKNKFFSIIAKDMKRNLDKIFERIQNLNDYLQEKDYKSLNDSLSNLTKYNYKTKAYLRNLIYWSRLETNLLPMNPTKVCISKLFANVQKDYEGLIQRKKIIITNSFENENVTILIDEYSFKIVLDNLFSNAVKFTNYHEYIQINHKIIDGYVNISIMNKGMHFPLALQNDVFNFEYNSEDDLDEEDRGSGLGLALSKELIEMNQGIFSILANENITEVLFSLPLKIQ